MLKESSSPERVVVVVGITNKHKASLLPFWGFCYTFMGRAFYQCFRSLKVKLESFDTKTQLIFEDLFKFFWRFTSFMCMSDLLSCISVFHMPGTCEGQKRVSVVLDLELQMVISCHLGAGNWTWVHCKNSKCSYLLAHPSSPSRPAFYLWFFIILPLSSYKTIVPCKNIERNPLKPKLRMACHILSDQDTRYLYNRAWIFHLIF